MIDTDRSGALDEREFIAYWIYATTTGGFRFDYNHHRQHRRQNTVRLGGVRYRTQHTPYGNRSHLKIGKGVKIRF
jgi:hypothetical protein